MVLVVSRNYNQSTGIRTLKVETSRPVRRVPCIGRPACAGCPTLPRALVPTSVCGTQSMDVCALAMEDTRPLARIPVHRMSHVSWTSRARLRASAPVAAMSVPRADVVRCPPPSMSVPCADVVRRRHARVTTNGHLVRRHRLKTSNSRASGASVRGRPPSRTYITPRKLLSRSVEAPSPGAPPRLGGKKSTPMSSFRRRSWAWDHACTSSSMTLRSRTFATRPFSSLSSFSLVSVPSPLIRFPCASPSRPAMSVSHSVAGPRPQCRVWPRPPRVGVGSAKLGRQGYLDAEPPRLFGIGGSNVPVFLVRWGYAVRIVAASVRVAAAMYALPPPYSWTGGVGGGESRCRCCGLGVYAVQSFRRTRSFAWRSRCTRPSVLGAEEAAAGGGLVVSLSSSSLSCEWTSFEDVTPGPRSMDVTCADDVPCAGRASGASSRARTSIEGPDHDQWAFRERRSKTFHARASGTIRILSTATGSSSFFAEGAGRINSF